MRRLHASLALLLLAAALLRPQAAAAGGDIRILVHGVPLRSDVPAQVIGGSVFVPLRALASALGAEVDWDGAGTATVRRGARRVTVTLGRTEAYVDGLPRELPSPPVAVAGRVLVPLRFIGEALALQVTWDPSTRTAAVLPRGPGGAGSAVAAEDREAAADTARAVAAAGPVAPDLVERVARELPALWEAVRTRFGIAGAAGLPRVVVVANREHYLEQLLRDGTPREDAERIARYAAGSARGNTVYLLAEAVAGDLAGVLAHELGHVAVSRRGLAGRIPQWLEEGLVEYVARSLAEGDRTTPQGSRYWGLVRQRVLERAASGTLEDLFTENRQFIDRLGDYPAHAQAMWAATLLVELAGWEAVAAYLDAVAAVGHPAAFEAAFQMTPEEFALRFRRFLKQQVGGSPAVTVRLELARPLNAWLAVFLPGRTESPSWRLTGSGTVTIAVAADRSLTVFGPVAGDDRRRWRLAEARDHLSVHVVPVVPLATDAGSIQQLSLFFADAYGYWYWLGAGAVVDGEFRDAGAEPGWPGLLRVVEVRTGGGW